MKSRQTRHAGVFRSHAEALRDNLLHVLQVSQQMNDGSDVYQGMTREELADKAGVSRSTVTRLISRNSARVNPDLDTLCRLASVLNVPPAFLLMTQKDWKRLFGAMEALGVVEELQSQFPDFDNAKSVAALAASAERIARRMNPTRVNDDAPPEQRQRLARGRQGARAMANLITWKGMPTHYRKMFAVAVQLGANTDVSEEA